MISIVHINFVYKLNFDVFIKHVISLDLFGSYSNINCMDNYEIEPKESIQKGAAIAT